jgi:hypothetical protein
MDASCSVIQNRAANANTTGSQLSADATRVREAGGAAPPAPSQTTSIAGNSTNEGGTTATRSTIAESTGANQSQQGQATTQGATPSQSLRSYDGSGTRARTAGAAPAASTGGDWTSVREKYKDCNVTPSTASFAIMANGQLYMIDDTAGAVRQRMSANTASSSGTDFQTITVMGTPQGDRISVTSVQ